MKKKLALYVGINLIIWIMLLFLKPMAFRTYMETTKTYSFQFMGYLYLYEGIIVILISLSSFLVFMAGRWIRLLCCICTCVLTFILLLREPYLELDFLAMVLVLAISGYIIHLFRIPTEEKKS